MKLRISLFAMAISCILAAQINFPKASLKADIEQQIGLTKVEVEFHRPSKNGREIFGELVPYAKVWRTGANENTTIEFSTDVRIAGEKLAKGKYALYTITNEDQWDVIFYKKTDNWGNPKVWNDDLVALKVKARVIKMPHTMETFNIIFDNLSSEAGTMSLLWDKTFVPVKIEVPTHEIVMQEIKTKLGEDASEKDYFGAANYYYSCDENMEDALKWINQSLKMSKKKPHYMYRLKSLIEHKKGDVKSAIKTAKTSLSAAKKAKDAEYIKMNEDAIKEWSKK